MPYPRIYLALDNCFASKRWTEPNEWMQIARDLGVFCIEASADTEIDPLYGTPGTLRDWIDSVGAASEKLGVKVVNLYSGHGTYATLGLAHSDPRVRDHIQHDWLEPMIRNAAALGAGLGFFCHAFPQTVLKDAELYHQAEDDLYRRLAELARYAQEQGLSAVSVEQMYSPHQIPWTIEGSLRLIREIFQQGSAPLYLTLDTGHQVGQGNFMRPDPAQIEAYVLAVEQKREPPDIWLGYPERMKLESLLNHLEWQRYLFAEPEDGDLYAWLRRLGRYAPIIHLQQTDGLASAHRPFTPKYNATGIVHPVKMLAALKYAYSRAELHGLPPPCQDIYLTIEVFSGTAERPAQILSNISESIAYWRRFIPVDGMTLEKLAESPL
jgi:sugar phosphate isomerase/epimerase